MIREQKWVTMMERWPAATVPLRGGRRRKLVLRRLRKGVPEQQRAKVWQWLSTSTNSKPLVPTRMKILSALPSSDSREESTTTEAVLQHRRDDGDIEDDFVLVSTSINGSQERRRHRLDRFGFIANMDRHGNLVDEDEDDIREVIPTMIQMKTTKGREQKWVTMMERWP